MSPYRTPPQREHEPASPAKQGALREERVIYLACVAFGVSRVLHAIFFEPEIGGTTALAILLGGWGARALVLGRARRARHEV